MVVNDGRLIADVLRTIAHEMVHHKQNEMGVLKNLEEAGKAGTKFENQANSIAGILIREYGKTNKKIYNESKMFFSETEQINMAIQNEINKLKTKY
jgi:predicted metalloprotease